MRNVLLIGVGLIGGSIALTIKKEHDVAIAGYDVQAANCEKAVSLGVIDKVATDLQQEAAKADLIIIATPVEATLNIMDQLSSIRPAIKALVMDVGSTKKTIMEKAEKLAEQNIVFIGGHPMAGSHKTGVESARPHLLENAYYILTPSSIASASEIEEAKDWLKGTRAKFIVAEPDEHDFLTGIVSHFPHLIASSLVRLAQKHANENPLVQQLAAGGFRDITRIASSSPKMWSDIVSQNKDHLLTLLSDWKEEMEQVISYVEIGDPKQLFDYFHGAKLFRDGLPVRSKGAIQPFSDLYVDILDTTGALSKVTTLLAEFEISIINITILEVREDLNGVLRLSFQNDNDRDKAQKVLHQENYLTHITE
ncbi:prephenate dehydrogenase [Fictibacillus phosphorivorans]|uniref:prephenate dehydrogenase n=1 Tax=Fictibacillus phosphorivorans TaxID=1221500 RepID=UPI00203BC5FB|nr:prephenate dehydrogenase [Fictibacillus phosphorivorans]MCM3719321.1 prephenate dehydrogenase [Fictibacillus phosphorivorans]MCM3776942.1 prephenate dehydrogenase [Fictibacillus phosphorivorans]